MKTTRSTLTLLLSVVILVATTQSALALGKSATSLFGNLVNPNAPGTKYFVTLTIYYLGLPANTSPDSDEGGSCPDGVDAPTSMLFFAKATRGNQIFFFSQESVKIFCLVEEEGSQRVEAVTFLEALVGHIRDAPSIFNTHFGVKSASGLVDNTAIDQGVVVGFNGDLGFIMLDLTLAIP